MSGDPKPITFVGVVTTLHVRSADGKPMQDLEVRGDVTLDFDMDGRLSSVLIEKHRESNGR